MKPAALILSAVAALTLSGCATSSRLSEMLGIPGIAPAATHSAAINVEMTRGAPPTPVKKRRFLRRASAPAASIASDDATPGHCRPDGTPSGSAADNTAEARASCAAAAATPTGPPTAITLPPEKKHGRMWKFFHRKQAKEAAARRAVETAPLPAGRPATAPDGMWPKQ